MYHKLTAFFVDVMKYIIIRVILRQKDCDQFYSWYVNSNMTEVVVQKS